jgi:hypothetical protein
MTAYAPVEEKLLTTDDWFNGIVNYLREHQVKMKDGTIDKELKLFYNTFMAGTGNEIAHQGKKLSQAYFVGNIMSRYVATIQQHLPEQMALAFHDSEILVWAEVKDDDWETEKALILAAAEVNAEYHKYGYDITTTFVETSDGLDIPNHYQPFITK